MVKNAFQKMPFYKLNHHFCQKTLTFFLQTKKWKKLRRDHTPKYRNYFLFFSAQNAWKFEIDHLPEKNLRFWQNFNVWLRANPQIFTLKFGQVQIPKKCRLPSGIRFRTGVESVIEQSSQELRWNPVCCWALEPILKLGKLRWRPERPNRLET